MTGDDSRSRSDATEDGRPSAGNDRDSNLTDAASEAAERSSPIDDSVVLITGSLSGIGHATARAFRARGWRVWATSRDPADVADLEARGCRTAALDVTDGDQIRTVVDRLLAADGRIDCLVNNAGFGQAGAVEDVPDERVRAQFDVNVYGPLRLVRAVLPHMRAQRSGTIVNVSSIMGRVSYPTRGVYAGSKHALEGITDALRNEVAGFGVDVVLVEPGAVDTGFDDRLRRTDESIDRTAAYERAYAAIDRAQRRAGRFATDPADVADVIATAATATDPDHRYVVGLDARLVLLSRHLPTRLTDWLTRRLVSRIG
ncbi:short-chain dehydrogenase/reductase SDR (plasmid) [Haloterrigena turkmenica DSM 5511]|uniref:Short-chain dehydrogenase/reductase SDR n=1 Tax=Haloterrigena turkmenica (strain ATCC 51198 / DSM 5511 / JCM 9101 / NCIMB 13204 / VKM B-1734 / 4k) TaxID=543526 RepID=D2S011_HALTV|nr:SDR family oxidoreductase [Haloterrigena turkmenica]ADB62708.1 short-chain dehydrogenase/reductase SDR [Haloterrigena turkmenica DSM 5511]